MLKLAREYADLLRSAGIDPEEVGEIELTHENPGYLRVKTKPRIEYIAIDIVKREGQE